MNVQELRKLQQAYSEVYQEIDENLIQSLDTLARDTAGRVGGKIGERRGRAETGNLPVLGDIGATIGRGQGTERGKQIYDKAKETVGGLLKQSYDPDLFDVILEYLLDEGYADTNENALVIMTNMSEEWTQSIIEQKTDPTKTAAEMASLRNTAFGSKKFQDAIYLSPSNPKGPNWDPKSVKTPGV